jgi:hypothetical protein
VVLATARDDVGLGTSGVTREQSSEAGRGLWTHPICRWAKGWPAAESRVLTVPLPGPPCRAHGNRAGRLSRIAEGHIIRYTPNLVFRLISLRSGNVSRCDHV